MPGIECRSGGVNGDHQLIVTFAVPVTFTSAMVTSGVGMVDSASASGNQITIDLKTVANAQTITITLFNVSNGSSTADVAVSMSLLLGDSNANGSVNVGDVAQTKSRIGEPVAAGNFRSDVNGNGTINASDTAIVKANIGSALP